MHVFNANLEWSAPRSITLKRSEGGYGFSVIGSAPVIIQSVEEKGPAKVCKCLCSSDEPVLDYLNMLLQFSVV